MSGPEVTESLTVLQAVADPIRWTVLSTLGRSTQCVCTLQEQVPVAANLLSYHLKVLRDAGLVTTSRRGRWIDYALAPDAAARMAAALPTGIAATASDGCAGPALDACATSAGNATVPARPTVPVPA